MWFTDVYALAALAGFAGLLAATKRWTWNKRWLLLSFNVAFLAVFSRFHGPLVAFCAGVYGRQLRRLRMALPGEVVPARRILGPDRRQRRRRQRRPVRRHGRFARTAVLQRDRNAWTDLLRAESDRRRLFRLFRRAGRPGAGGRLFQFHPVRADVHVRADSEIPRFSSPTPRGRTTSAPPIWKQPSNGSSSACSRKRSSSIGCSACSTPSPPGRATCTRRSRCF